MPCHWALCMIRPAIEIRTYLSRFGRASAFIDETQVHPAMSEHPSKKRQVDKFREAARELETDQSEEHFNAILKRVAGAKPHDKVVERAGKGAVVRPTKPLKPKF